MSTAPAVRVTYCPYIPPRFAQPEQTTYPHSANPVSVHAAANGELVSNGIAWEDSARMQTRLRKGASHHRTGIPDFVMNREQLLDVVVRYVEGKAGITKKHKRRGTLQERLRRAEAKLLTRRKNKIATLERLCERHLTLRQAGDEAYRALEKQCANIDMQLRTIDRPAAIAASILYLSYRAGLDSVGVASELGISPVMVRQVCCRIRKLAGVAARRRLLTPEEKHERIAEKAARRVWREKRRAERQAQREVKKKVGRLCKLCGQPTGSPANPKCASCKATALSTAARRRRQGLCACGNQRDENFSTCRGCRLKSRAASAKYAAQKKKPVSN